MLLAIDVGNTRIKAAVFEHNTLIEQFFIDSIDLEIQIKTILNHYPNCQNLIVAAVGDVEKEVFLAFSSKLNVHFVTHDFRFPFINRYETPQTLGIDRMVLAAGAVLLYPEANRLVIDAGTCITYDFIESNKHYLGGAISPGTRLRYESLHNNTAKLPLVTPKIPDHFIGNSTLEAIHSGVIQGTLHEIEGFIAQYQKQYSNIIIILTGGDADFLAKRLKNTIFANSNFLLECLNQTFQYQTNNVKKN